MPSIKIDDTLDMFYELHSFVEPWKEPETILLVHGIGGCTTEWYAWMPPLTPKYQVLRVDLRGWGRSTIPPEGYPWSMDNFARDLKILLDKLGIRKVHFVGTKLGGRIALHFARHYSDRLHSLTLISTPMQLGTKPGDTRASRPSTEQGRAGVEAWARRTMLERLGKVSQEMNEWWIDLYASQSPRVTSEVYSLAWDTDEYSHLKNIKVPTLVVDSTAENTVERISAWQTQISDSKLAMIPVTTEGRQITASAPLACVKALTQFLDGLHARKGGAQ